MTDASPYSNISVSSDEGEGKHTHPHQVAATPKEQQLIELLSQAAAEIRAERAKVKHLEEQLAKKGGSGGSTGSMPTMVMKQKIQDLALENYVAVQQIADLRLKVSKLEDIVADQAQQIQEHRDSLHVVKPRVAQGTASSRQRSVPPPSRAEMDNRQVHGSMEKRLPPQNHRFDPMASVQRAHSPQKKRAQSSSGRRDATPTTSDNQMAGTRNYNDVMINRLRRAIAPPPTKEQMGEVVHAMLQELVRQLAKHGAVLHMKRVDHGVYTCGKKKLHLTVDSNRLVVKAGGGHVDLLEHIERNKLCTKA